MKITKSQLKSLIEQCIIEEQEEQTFNNFKKQDLDQPRPKRQRQMRRMPSCWEDFDELADLFKVGKNLDQQFSGSKRNTQILYWFENAHDHIELMNYRFRIKDYIEEDGKNPELAEGYNVMHEGIRELKGSIRNAIDYFNNRNPDGPSWFEEPRSQELILWQLDKSFKKMLQVWDDLQLPQKLSKYKRYERKNPRQR